VYAATLEGSMTGTPDPNVRWPVRRPDGQIVYADSPQHAMDLERRRLVHWPPPVEAQGSVTDVTA
jgi:hypothetical protein